ncbi:MAG: hypothetical protein JO057_11805 [Chloroflexi bacterium]|nr:hypothetical protein [Chloroflexota bacterium]
MKQRRKQRFTRTAVVLGSVALVATPIMIFTGFFTDQPSWIVTLVATLVAFCAIGAVLLLFLVLFD